MMLLSSFDMPPLFDTYATVPGRYSCKAKAKTKHETKKWPFSYSEFTACAANENVIRRRTCADPAKQPSYATYCSFAPWT